LNKTLYILVLTISFLISSNIFSQKNINPNGYNKFYYKDGKLASEGLMKNGKPDGYWKTYYENGKLKSEGNRKFFELDSLWIFYDEDGDTTKKINYYQGKRTGFTYNYIYTRNKDSVKIGGLVSKTMYLNNLKEGSEYRYKKGKLDKIIYYKNDKRQGRAVQLQHDTLIVTIYEYRNDYLVFKEKINRYNKQKNKNGTWKEFYPNNIIKTEKNYFNGKLNGYYKVFDKNGKMIKSYLYRKDSLISDNIIEEPKIIIKDDFYTSGKPKSTGGYIDTIPVGLHKYYNEQGDIATAKFFDESGIMISEGALDVNSKKTGKWVFYYKTGEIKAKGNYKRNRKTGEWNYYFRNGDIEQKGSFTKNKHSGTWIWYYPSGKVWREEEYVSGKEEGSFIEYNEDGKILAKGEYFDGERTGEWVFDTGDVTMKGEYENNERNGVWKAYNRNNRLVFEGNYVQGVPDGRHVFFYDSGIIREEYYYVMGEPDKLHKKYDTTGLPIITERYKNGILKRINGRKINIPKE